MSKRTKIIFIVLLVLLAASTRLIKHPFNFTPIAAMSIFAGCYLGKKWAVFLPLAAMFVGDIFIGFYDWKLMFFVYLSITLSFGIGLLLKKYKNWQNVIFASLASSVTFFVLTNFFVWALYSWYPKNLAGLTDCFIKALPFFRNTMIGDLVYAVVLFSAFEAVMVFSEKRSLNKTANKIEI